MLLDFFRQLWYQTNFGRNESVTTSIVDYNVYQQQYIDNNETASMNNFDENKLSEAELLASDPNNHLTKSKSKSNTKYPQHSSNNNKYDKRKINDLPIFSIYILFATLFIFICTIVVLLIIYINKVTDLNQLRDSLNNEFINKSDINLIIENVLKDLRNNGGLEAKSYKQHG